MPAFETSTAFFSLSLLLGFSPGPDNLFVLMQSATHGRKAGFCVVLGLCCGLLVHTAAVALGLAAVFAASPAAFTVLKFAGAAYLAYLAWQAWHAPANAKLAQQAPPMNPWRMLARGFIMNLTNPKVIFFFLAFLPQFVASGRGAVVLQLCWFGFLFILATLVSFGLITCFAAFLGARLRSSPRMQRRLHRLTAIVFAGLALRLVLAKA
ncbi:LysE family translocator [Noviherbaspirillum sedimenti]|uniref:LysE family translocator n=1 Tax=Noviherbaspirillum sedimenti TaxID=2320865 RepID=A0A3A3G7Q4_9BURK|nr:LysE family translocator [Noviherbaspirillum sedimenti]RJG04448.1 LysE family translocator [Noviherbaspirillum sedimenti]